MDALYTMDGATVVEIREAISNPPTLTALRTTLSILEGKGHVTHREENGRYTYEPTVARSEMASRSLKALLNTFFEGSAERAVATMLNSNEIDLDDDQLQRIAKMIEEAKRDGR
jgi:predicted transcriptional regulator